MLDFRFSNTPGGQNQDAIAMLLVQPRLWIPGGDYPAHTEWKDKAIAQVASGHKRAMIAYWGSEAVGSVIYQRHPNDPSTVEIRNLSVEKHARGRLIASFLLRQTEYEAVVDFPGASRIVTDTKQTNGALVSFALANGYTVNGVSLLDGTDFAHNGVPDVILSKDLGLNHDQCQF